MLSLGEPFAPSAIVAVDVRSPKAGKLGWAVLPSGVTGRSIDALVREIARGLQNGSVALGFEAPLWVPARAEEMTITALGSAKETARGAPVLVAVRSRRG
jgi:hypothetical protein